MRRYRSLLLLALLLLLACNSPRENGRPGPEQFNLAKRMLAGVVERPELAHSLPYRLYVPPRPDPTVALPLIVFLHSSGANGDDNLSQLGESDVGQLIGRAQQEQPALVVAPQCPLGSKWVTREEHAPHLNYDQSQRPESEQMVLVLDLIADLSQRFPVDQDRIYLMGASSGAAGTWDVVTRRPDHPFAAAVPMTGIGDPSRVAGIAKMPIWAFHGALDKGNPPENSRALVAALRKLGSSIRYTEYPDVGHITWDRAFAEPELFSWLFSQRRSAWQTR